MFKSDGTDRVLAILAGNLAPYVGATMANASVRGISSRLGISARTIDRDSVQRLLDALAPGLDVYVGRDKALLLVDEIWKQLNGLEAGR